jgi:hypothetical protein
MLQTLVQHMEPLGTAREPSVWEKERDTIVSRCPQRWPALREPSVAVPATEVYLPWSCPLDVPALSHYSLIHAP